MSSQPGPFAPFIRTQGQIASAPVVVAAPAEAPAAIVAPLTPLPAAPVGLAPAPAPVTAPAPVVAPAPVTAPTTAAIPAAPPVGFPFSPVAAPVAGSPPVITPALVNNNAAAPIAGVNAPTSEQNGQVQTAGTPAKWPLFTSPAQTSPISDPAGNVFPGTVVPAESVIVDSTGQLIPGASVSADGGRVIDANGNTVANARVTTAGAVFADSQGNAVTINPATNRAVDDTPGISTTNGAGSVPNISGNADTSTKSNPGEVAGLVCVVLVAFFVIIALFYRRRKRAGVKSTIFLEEPSPAKTNTFNPMIFASKPARSSAPRPLFKIMPLAKGGLNPIRNSRMRNSSVPIKPSSVSSFSSDSVHHTTSVGSSNSFSSFYASHRGSAASGHDEAMPTSSNRYTALSGSSRITDIRLPFRPFYTGASLNSTTSASEIKNDDSDYEV